MRRPARASRLVGFGKVHLLGRQSLLAINRGPGRRGVPAAQELLVDAFVAASAIAGGQSGCDHEAVVVFLFLSLGRLMAVDAVHPFPRMYAHFVFVDD
jgi:hypothetical protein